MPGRILRTCVLKLYLLILTLSEYHVALHAGSFRRYSLQGPLFKIQFQPARALFY